MMIPRTKFGDCSECFIKDTECVKVGKNLYCLNCRNKQKRNVQLDKAKKSTLSRNLYKVQKEKASPELAEKTYLIQDLDQIVSRIVRQIESDKHGNVTCYTCGYYGEWKKFDCGHYISRHIMALRWDLRNLKPQCKKCNQILYGNLESFTKALEIETPGITNILFEESRNIKKWSKEELKELIIIMRSKLKIIESR